MVSQAELILRVITLWFLVLSHFFRDGMGPFNKVCTVNNSNAMPNLNTVCTICYVILIAIMIAYNDCFRDPSP